MESSSFYVTLPSNASMDVYPDNTASTYTIHMPKTIYLKETYEVGLAEIQYPHSWRTFNNERDFNVFVSYDNPVTTQVYFPRGYYKSIPDLINELNKAIDRELQDDDEEWKIKFIYNKFTRKVRVQLKEHCRLRLTQGLANVLGFNPTLPTYFGHQEDITVFFGEYQSDIYNGFYTLYVYCSLCEPQIVGDSYVPLLRTVGVQGQDGDVIIKAYGEPQYIPVSTNKFDTIEINIKNDVGEAVSFGAGKVICKLHFRLKWKPQPFT